MEEISTESQSTALSPEAARPKKKRGPSSKYYQYFNSVPLEGGTEFTCTLCAWKKKFTATSFRTDRLATHFNEKHNSTNADAPVDLEKLNRAIVKWLLLDNRPFHTVSTPSFRELMSIACPSSPALQY